MVNDKIIAGKTALAVRLNQKYRHQKRHVESM